MSNAGQSTRDAYLEGQIQTATPQKLHLLLIEGAIRFATQAKQSLEVNDTIAAAASTDRCRKVVAEMLASVRTSDSEISRSLSDIYFFLYRTLAEEQLGNQESKIDEVLQVLEVESETWRQVCEKHGSSTESGVVPPRMISPTSLPTSPGQTGSNLGTTGPGFSLEA